MAKSEDNHLTLKTIIEQGHTPLAYRYFLLLSHYRTPTSFSSEALGAAGNAYRKLKETFGFLVRESPPAGEAGGGISEKYKKEFSEAVANDLNTPEALAVVWKLVKDESVPPLNKRVTLLDFDQVLGLDLEHNEYEVKNIPAKVEQLMKERESARIAGDYSKSDWLREEIERLGYVVEDTTSGPKISRS